MSVHRYVRLESVLGGSTERSVPCTNLGRQLTVPRYLGVFFEYLFTGRDSYDVVGRARFRVDVVAKMCSTSSR